MKASELISALTAAIALQGDGEMQDGCGWPITHIGSCEHEGKTLFFAESDEVCTCFKLSVAA